MIKNKFKELETDRLVLKKITIDYLDDMYHYASDKEVTRYVAWSKHNTKADTLGFLVFIQDQYETGEYYDWAIFHKKDQKMIGTVGFSSYNKSENACEIGYSLAKEYWNQGLATDAIQKVISFAFSQLKLSAIHGYTYPENEASQRVMIKCGMKKTGTETYALLTSDETIEAVHYKIEKQHQANGRKTPFFCY